MTRAVTLSVRVMAAHTCGGFLLRYFYRLHFLPPVGGPCTRSGV